MKDDLVIKNGVVIPAHELIFSVSRAGGPGGQHVNKASTRVTVHWKVSSTSALSDEQKERVLTKLASQLTNEGEVVLHCGSGRSQAQNKKEVLERLATLIRKSLHVKKKRMKTRVPKGAKEARLKKKKKRGEIKKERGKKHFE